MNTLAKVLDVPTTVITKLDDLYFDILVSNVLKEMNNGHNIIAEKGMISYLGVPLLWPNGELFGTLCVLDHEPIARAGIGDSIGSSKVAAAARDPASDGTKSLGDRSNMLLQPQHAVYALLGAPAMHGCSAVPHCPGPDVCPLHIPIKCNIRHSTIRCLDNSDFEW